MADTIAIISYAELIGTRGLSRAGSRETPVSISLTGEEVLDVAASIPTATTETFWDSATSPVATVEVIIAVADVAQVYLKLTGTTAADYSFVALKPGLAQIIGGKVLSYAAEAEQVITKIEVVNKNAGTASVRVLAN